MDTKLERIYCTISEYKYFYIFNSNSLNIFPIVMKPGILKSFFSVKFENVSRG